MKRLNLKKNITSKYFAELIAQHDIVLFLHPTKEFNQLRYKILYSNHIKVLTVKSSMLSFFFCDSNIKKKRWISSTFILIFFRTFVDFILFINFYFTNKHEVKLLLLFLFWCSRNRFLSMSYISNYFTLSNTATVSYDDFLNFPLTSFFLISNSVINIILSIFCYINFIILFLLIPCLRTDN